MTSIAIICIMYKWNCTIWGHQTQKHPLKGFSTASRGFVFFQASLPPLPAETFGKTWCNGLISASAGTEAVRLGSEMTMMKLNQGLLGSFPKTACELLGCLLLTLYTWDVFHILWYKCSSCFLVAPAFLHNQNAPWHLDDFVDGIQDFSQTHETLLLNHSRSPFPLSDLCWSATYSWEDRILLHTPWPQIPPNSRSGAYEFGGIREQERDLQAALIWQWIPIWTTQHVHFVTTSVFHNGFNIQLFMVHTLSLRWVPGTKATRRMWKRL